MSSNSANKHAIFTAKGEKLATPRFLPNSDKYSRKALASHANISGWWKRGTPVPYTISREIIKRIAQSSETVAAILEHACNDIAGAGYTFKKAEGVKKPNEKQHQKVIDFFRQPNPDDQGDEWLYDFIYDFLLYGDGYWEKSGTLDDSSKHPTYTENWFGGELEAIWHVDSSTMKILHTMKTGQMPDPESGVMAYEQETLSGKVRFDSRKITRASRFRQGRLYGESPLLPLLNIIAGQINLTGYIGNLFKGNVPKHLLNLGDISVEEFERMMLSIQEQMEQATNPFGVIGVNVPEGFEIKRLMETNREGAFLETLDYYRQEICSVFGIPPTKMGWSTPGRIGTPEELLDTWYDKIEHIHDRLEKIINRSILPDLGITDWVIKFNSVRPKKTRLEAQALRDKSIGIRILRQENVISVNEARETCGFEPVDEDWADDIQHPSPMLAGKEGNNPGGLGTPHEGESLMPDILDVVDSLSESVNELSDKIDKVSFDAKKLAKRKKKVD
jgi:hypothetical protein